MIIIRDTSGIRYELNRRTLSETPHGRHSCYVILKELLLPAPEGGYGATPVRYRDSKGRMDATAHRCNWLRNHNATSIGCRTFTPADYKKIMTAAKGAK